MGPGPSWLPSCVPSTLSGQEALGESHTMANMLPALGVAKQRPHLAG